MATARARLEAAYRAAEYHVPLDWTILQFRIGEHDATAQERLQRALPARHRWVILTPCNPGSEVMAPAWNQARVEELGQMIGQLGVAALPSVNHDPDAGFPDEAGFVVADPPANFAESAGRRFGQNAVVSIPCGEAPLLVWLGRR